MTGPIVVATDFSARADRAIDRALMLGAQWDTPVSLVHAVSRKSAEQVDAATLEAMMKSVLPEGVSGVEKVEFHYPEGSPPKAIADTANALSASVIVMGPARYNSLGDYFLGTAVDYALRHCEQPVLIVKQRPHRPYGPIVVATDYSAPSVEALKIALDWFPDADVHLAHAWHVPFDAWQRDAHVQDDVLASEELRMTEYLEGAALGDEQRARITTHAVLGSAHDAMRRVISDSGANLAVIGSHGETGFRHATIGSMASALLETTVCDALMVTSRR